MLFADIAATSAAVASTSGRRAKVALLAQALTALAATGDAAEIAAGAAYLAGEMRQRQIGVGWATLRELPPAAGVATLEVREVDRRFAELGALAGTGSQARRRALVQSLFASATSAEQTLLGGIISGEVRQGAQAGLLADAIASAARVPGTDVRRALLLSGDLKTVAVAALVDGLPGLAAFRLTLGRPLAPMLAQAASGIEEALAATGAPAAVDAKLDGVRIQVHRDGDDVSVFSRSLDDITTRVPEIVAAARGIAPHQAVLDGEALIVGPDGRARPFQETSGRAAQLAPGLLIEKVTGGNGLPGRLAIDAYFFDVLHLEGADLFDEAGRAVRWAALDDAVPAPMLVSRRMVDSAEDAESAFADALDDGHEGVVVKSVESIYDVGRRGAALGSR